MLPVCSARMRSGSSVMMPHSVAPAVAKAEHGVQWLTGKRVGRGASAIPPQSAEQVPVTWRTGRPRAGAGRALFRCRSTEPPDGVSSAEPSRSSDAWSGVAQHADARAAHGRRGATARRMAGVGVAALSPAAAGRKPALPAPSLHYGPSGAARRSSGTAGSLLPPTPRHSGAGCGSEGVRKWQRTS